MAASKWRINDKGEVISPEAQKTYRQHEGKKRRKKQGDKYLNRTLKRLCPKCGTEITKKRTLERNDSLGIYRDVTAFLCEKCFASWTSKQTIKVWERLKVNRPRMTNKQFKESLRAIY